MEPEERQMLERLLRISEDNNRILRRMRRSVIVGRLMHVLYWLVILGVSIGGYYFIRPYLGNLNSALETVQQVKSKYVQ